MNLGDIRTAVRERLDDPTFDTIKLDRWTNWVLQDIYSRANFPFKHLDTTFSTVDGTQDYLFSSIDANLEKISKVTDMTNEVELTYLKDFSQFADMTDDEENRPAYWMAENSTLKLYPIPDAVYSIEVVGVQTLDDLTDASQSPALPDKWNEIVVLGVYQKALEWNDDFAYAGVIERQYEQKLARMVASASETSGQDNTISWDRPEI